MNKIQLTPRQWGWKQNYLATWQEALIQKPSLRGLFPARIIGREHHSYTIVFPDFWAEFDGLMPAFGIDKEHSGQTTPGIYQDIRVRGRFEHEALSAADYPVCGDWVLIDTAAQTPRIEHVLERHTSLSRASSGTATEEQVLAANIDVLLLVFALDGGRNFLERLLERSLVVAHASGAMPWILLNKADLADSETRETALAIAAHIAPSVPVTLLSAKSGEGVPELLRLLNAGDTIGMLGKSGVGKSAIVNALSIDREEHSVGVLAREGKVRSDDLRGRHTTTSSRLYRLPSGVLVIDSPGIRELKLWADETSLDCGFPEIAELAIDCRFADCTHSSEPGCAVTAALNAGELDYARWLSWQELRKEQAWLDRRVNEQARRDEEKKWKQIAKDIRRMYKQR